MWIYTLFPQILNMSLTASIVIVFVLLARLLLKKTPKIFSYALWAVVLFRLLCPMSISSEWSLLNVLDVPFSQTGNIEYIPTDIVHTENPQVTIPVPGISEAINDNLPQGEEQLAADPLEAPMAVATLVWLIGILAPLLHSIISLIKLRRKLIGTVHLRDNVYLADYISSPFVMGLLRPKIYLPSTLTEQEQAYIIQHEQHHIRRFDPAIKILAFVALCVHWFNPLVWLAFVLSGKDMEMSCDEAVMKTMGNDIRAEYSTSLLCLATGRKIFASTPLAFGEGNTKSRIKNVMNYRKPTFWVVTCTCIVMIVVGIGFATNPKVSRHFDMTGNNLSDLQPLEITQSIGEIVGKEFSELELTPDNFGLTVSADFSYIESEAIRFLYDIDDESCKAAQLRIFSDDTDFFVTEPNNNWDAPKEQTFKLYTYLEALKYLPREEIAALCPTPPQRFAIELSSNDRKYNEERQLFYNKDGVAENNDWNIRLDIQPMYGADGYFNGVGNDMIYVFYSADENKLTTNENGLTEKPLTHDAFKSITQKGKTAATHWLNSYMDDSVPNNERIEDYTIDDVTVIAVTPKEGQIWQDMNYHYVVRVEYSITTATEEYLAPGDGVSGKGTFANLSREFYVKSLDNGNFEIIGVGTGGGEQEFLEHEKSRPLTQDEIDKVNIAFEPVFPIEHEEYKHMVNPVCFFFGSSYKKPLDMDFTQFIWYFSTEDMLEQAEMSEEEFQLLKELDNFPFDEVQSLSDMPVPIQRKPLKEVNKVLEQYMGITASNLNTEEIPFLSEPYNAFYTYTSDAGFMGFYCTGGEIEGDVVRLFSDYATLTLEEKDGRYLMVSHITTQVLSQ